MDPLIGAALIGGVAQLGGGFMSAQGAADANRQNAAINNQNQTFQNNVNSANWEHQQAVNSENWAHSLQMLGYNQDFAREQSSSAYAFANDQAERNRQFQAYMSGTAYQRATTDMRNAGINPMLAYMQGGAATPAGATGSASPLGASGTSSTSANSQGAGSDSSLSMGNTQAEMGRAIGRIAQSAVDTYKSGKEAEQTEALTGRTNAEKHLTNNKINTENWNTDRAMHDAALTRDARFLQNAQTDTERERAALVRAQKAAATASSAASYASARRDMGAASNEELRNRESRPINEGGYGRGTGIGPSFPERTLRHLEDSVTEFGR